MPKSEEDTKSPLVPDKSTKKPRKRGRRGKGGSSGNNPRDAVSKNLAESPFVVEMIVGAKTYYSELKGNADLQSPVLYSDPNVLLVPINMAQAAVWGDETEKVNNSVVPNSDHVKDNYLYNKYVDTFTVPLIYNELRSNIPQVIPYNTNLIYYYIQRIYGICARYIFLASWVDKVGLQVGKLQETYTAADQLLGTTDQNRYIDEVKSDLEIVRSIMSRFVFPKVLVDDLVWLLTPRRTHNLPNAPIAQYMPFRVGQTAMRPTSVSGGYTYGWNSASEVTPRIADLVGQVKYLIQDPAIGKLMADMKRVGIGDPISLPESIPLGMFDGEFMDLWQNNGVVHEGTGNMVPNTAKKDLSVRYELGFRFMSPPSDRIIRNLAFGHGKKTDEIRGRHMSNVVAIDWVRDDVESSDSFPPLLWTVDDATDADEALSFKKVPSTIDLDPLVIGAAVTTFAALKALVVKENTAITNYVEELMANKALDQFFMGWKTILNADDALSVDDVFEGKVPVQPMSGERYWADGYRITNAQLAQYRKSWGM